MKLLVALALLVLAVAEAHHTPEHTLRGPRFKTGWVYKYDVQFNVSSGVLGLSSQVSRAAYKAEVSIYAKDQKDHILKIENVFTSSSIPAADGKYGYIPMERNSELEDRISAPITFTLEDGKVTKYTLSLKENLETQKIKRSILRSLEMHVPESALQQIESGPEPKVPVTYNVTEDTETGVHTAQYMITVSPYTEFPAQLDVYNITRSDDFEAGRYPAYHVHQNFRTQGCSEVCRKQWRSNEYAAGCPVGFEPQQSPIKTSFNHQHHLSMENKIMNPEIIKTTEVHVAQMYDQDIEVLIMYEMRRKTIDKGTLIEPTEQQHYENLDDMASEIKEKEIDALCQYKTADESIDIIKKLLKDVSGIIVKGDLEQEQSTLIGQKLILLQDALSRLSVANLVTLSSFIKELKTMVGATGEERIIRQVWMDILPLIGTEASVTFLVQYIQEGLKERSRQPVLVWEAKEMLEALPLNIHLPTERNVKELKKLFESSEVSKNHLVHSAAYLAVAKILGGMCGKVPVVRSKPIQQSSWFSYQKAFQSIEEDSSGSYELVKCPELLMKETVKEIAEKLRSSQKKEEIAVYLETLAHMRVLEVLPFIAKYVYGTAENLQQYSPSYVDFVKTVSIFALHNVVAKYPEEVLQIVLPVYFNATEGPKVRNAAFGVLIRAQPSLEILQHIAIRSWEEESKEVGSYVTSTLESFGNASLPCMMLTSYRIKKVMPQVKRFDIGIHHSKNLLWTYFDEQRQFGLEKRFEYTMSNESTIPSAIYKSISYSTDSLQDVLIQMALNVQGMTREKIMKRVEDFLHLPPITSFDSETEEKIFEKARMHVRIPDDLRLTIYRRMFYASSYYYLDSESVDVLRKSLLEYVMTHVKKNRDWDGYLVKVFFPSTYHTKTIAKTLPYPIEFEMRQPLVFAVKIKSLERETPTSRRFHLHLRPSVYFTKLYTNQIKNIGDCKEVGVYHEHKLAISFPFEIKFRGIDFPNITVKYRIPELKKKVLAYFSESGTFAGKKTLEKVPSTSERVPIRTQPAPFKIEKDVTVVGVPPLRVQLHTEDIGFFTHRLPKDFDEYLDYALRRIMNAGWRHTCVNVTLEENFKVWPQDTEITFSLRYNRGHITKYTSQPESLNRARSFSENSQDETQSLWNSQSQSNQEESSQSWFWKHSEKDEDWSSIVRTDDVLSNKLPQIFIEQGKKAVKKLIIEPHIKHTLEIEIETKPKPATAFIKAVFNHTYDKQVYSARVDAAAKLNKYPHTYEATWDHFIIFKNRPNEFKYGTQEPTQLAVFLSAFGLPVEHTTQPWENVETVFKGIFSYESLEQLLKDELQSRVEPKYYQPETHEECIRDVQKGKVLSMDCVKAISEKSIFNKLRMAILWKERVPEILKIFARRTDIYMKHFLFHDLKLTDEPNEPNKIIITIDSINKFTDKLVSDIRIVKPDETVEFNRVPTSRFQPLSSVYSIPEVFAMHVTNNSYPPTCVMMEKYVRTYDERTYRFSAEKCSYVLSTHCTLNKYFAITARGLETPRGTKEVRIYVGDKTVVLTPKSGPEYKIEFERKEYTVDTPRLLDETHEIYVYPIRTVEGVNLRVVAQRAGIKVLYDGVNIKVQVDPRYKGELCGLCSEFDGEELREYRGLDRCLYSHPVDFANSAITNREGSCEKNRLLEKRICDDEGVRGKSTEHDDYEPTTRRNIVEARGTDYCFSTLPVPVCEDNAPPTQTVPLQVAFHCLPKRDVTARKLLTEAKRRVLGEIAYKSADFQETVQVAKKC